MKKIFKNSMKKKFLDRLFLSSRKKKFFNRLKYGQDKKPIYTAETLTEALMAGNEEKAQEIMIELVKKRIGLTGKLGK